MTEKKIQINWQLFEDSLPKKIKRTRKRPNVSGMDLDYIKNINGEINGNTVILPGKTVTGKPKVANYIGNLCESITFGMTKPYFTKNPKLQPRQANGLYPDLYKNLKLLAESEFPDFKYNTITLNHNLKCKPHKDSRNVGNSTIIGFGKYTGGELVIEGKKHNIQYKSLVFNGAENEHWVNDFDGDRWTAIYYYRNF